MQVGRYQSKIIFYNDEHLSSHLSSPQKKWMVDIQLIHIIGVKLKCFHI